METAPKESKGPAVVDNQQQCLQCGSGPLWELIHQMATYFKALTGYQEQYCLKSVGLIQYRPICTTAVGNWISLIQLMTRTKLAMQLCHLMRNAIKHIIKYGYRTHL